MGKMYHAQCVDEKWVNGIFYNLFMYIMGKIK